MLNIVVKCHLGIAFFMSEIVLPEPVRLCRCCYHARSIPCTLVFPPCPVLQVYFCAVGSPIGCLHVITKRKQILYRYYIYIEMFFHLQITYASDTRSQRQQTYMESYTHSHTDTHPYAIANSNLWKNLRRITFSILSRNNVIFWIYIMHLCYEMISFCFYPSFQ